MVDENGAQANYKVGHTAFAFPYVFAGFAVQCQAPRKAELDFASWQVAFDSWCLAVSVCSSMVGAAAKFSELVDYKHRVRLMRAPLHIALHLLLPSCVRARSCRWLMKEHLPQLSFMTDF